jgi:hypothetical protein
LATSAHDFTTRRPRLAGGDADVAGEALERTRGGGRGVAHPHPLDAEPVIVAEEHERPALAVRRVEGLVEDDVEQAVHVDAGLAHAAPHLVEGADLEDLAVEDEVRLVDGVRAVLQFSVGVLEFGHPRLEAVGHEVEVVGELAHLVAAAHVDAHVEVAGGEGVRAAGHGEDRHRDAARDGESEKHGDERREAEHDDEVAAETADRAVDLVAALEEEQREAVADHRERHRDLRTRGAVGKIVDAVVARGDRGGEQGDVAGVAGLGMGGGGAARPVEEEEARRAPRRVVGEKGERKLRNSAREARPCRRRRETIAATSRAKPSGRRARATAIERSARQRDDSSSSAGAGAAGAMTLVGRRAQPNARRRDRSLTASRRKRPGRGERAPVRSLDSLRATAHRRRLGVGHQL